MSTRLLAGVIILMPTLAIAQEAPETATCLKLENDTARLACYDKALGYETPEEVFVSGDGWVMIARTDEFNEANTSRVYLEEVGRAGERDAAVLSVGCRDDGGYGILLYKSSFINTSRRISVRYRFDDNQPVSENWHGAAGGHGAVLPDNYRDFRTQLTNAEKLVIEMNDFQGARHRHTFDGLQKNKSDLDFVMGGCRS